MTNRVIKLIEKCADIEPLEGRIFILPDKVRTYKDKRLIGRPKDPEVKEENIDSETEMVMIEEMVDVNHRFQTATVLKVPEDEIRFKAGDMLVYTIGTTFEFDLIKGVSFIRKYDVVAVVRG